MSFCFIINLSIVLFLLSTSLRKLVCTRSLGRSVAEPTGLFAVRPRLIRYLCRVRHWYSLASRRPRSVFLPLQLFLLSILCSPCPTPLALKCLSCTGLCSRPPSLLIHICVHGFSDYQLADDSQILSAAHLSFLRYRYVYIAAFSDATFFRCFRLNSPFSSKAPWLLRFYCQATIGPV